MSAPKGVAAKRSREDDAEVEVVDSPLKTSDYSGARRPSDFQVHVKKTGVKCTMGGVM